MRQVQTKVCSKCKQEKTVSEFGTASAIKRDGYNSWCKQCVRDASKRFSQTPVGIYTSIKGNMNFHKKKPVIISREEFVDWYNSQEKKCAYCGIPENLLFLIKNDPYMRRSNRLTIDCKDNKLGYIESNIVLSCRRCNGLKNYYFSHEAMKDISQKYIKPKWIEDLNYYKNQ